MVIEVVAHGHVEWREVRSLVPYYYPKSNKEHYAPVPEHLETEVITYDGEGRIYINWKTNHTGG